MKLIEKDVLDELSYTSLFTQSLKQISLRETSLELILQDIGRYRAGYIDTLIQENLIGSRFKSDESIVRKYNKIINQGLGFKQCFNDVLGFRLRVDEYPDDIPEYFRIVDLRNGKLIDDGYRALHLYYQRDSHSYPIEVQLWGADDYQFNVWSHRHIYKFDDAEIGKEMRKRYDEENIIREEKFLEILREVQNGR